MTDCQSILIVEDNDDIRDTLEDILRTEGYRVYAVKNGREAVLALKHIPGRSLILLDMMTPVMDGWQFLEARKENHVMAEMPVVVISALDAAKALAINQDPLHAEGYLRKPVGLAALFEMVQHHCGHAA